MVRVIHMESNKLVQILMATYCGEQHIREQLESILNQSYEHWQLIIRDDCSTDETRRIIQEYCMKYPEQITFIQSHIPSGSAKNNFMHLLELATADYIMFCDQDDVWDENKIEVSLKKMIEIEGEEKVPALVHSDLRVVDENLKLIEESFEKYMSMDYTHNTVNYLLIENVITGCTMMINKSLHKYAVSNYQIEDMTMHDQWLALLASSIGIVAVLPQSTISYRQHQGNSVGTQNVVSIKNLKSVLAKSREIHESLERSMRQAQMLETNVGALMEPEIRKVVNTYAGMLNKHKLGRIMTIQKHHFYAKSKIKQCAILVLI